MTTVTGNDGQTYTYEGTTLTISGSGTANAIKNGKVNTNELDCTGMTDLIVESGITSLGQELLFSGCTSLARVTLPEGLLSIGSYNFMGCTALTEIILPSTLTSMLGMVFYGCTSLAKIYFKGGQISPGTQALNTQRSAGTTIYSNGWADDVTLPNTLYPNTTMTFVTGLPETYEHITWNGHKVQADSAIRDGNGNKIDIIYATKAEIHTAGALFGKIKSRIYNQPTTGASPTFKYCKEDGTSATITSTAQTLTVEGQQFTIKLQNYHTLIGSGAYRLQSVEVSVTLNGTTYVWNELGSYAD